MVAGLLMLTRAAPPAAAAPLRDIATSGIAHDRQFVRLLANMPLRTQSELVHVY
jgi:hypothetical protein